MNKKYWLHADPPENETEEEKLARLKKEQEEQALLDKIMNQVSDKIKGYEDKIKELETKLGTQIKVDNPPNPDKKDDLPKPDDTNKDLIAKIDSMNLSLLTNAKKELAKKYGLEIEDLSNITSMEKLSEMETIYEKAFGKAEKVFTSTEKITEVLKKNKKMITDLDNTLGEEQIKAKQDEKTKAIFGLFKKK